jgi:hypothetical protein
MTREALPVGPLARAAIFKGSRADRAGSRRSATYSVPVEANGRGSRSSQ